MSQSMNTACVICKVNTIGLSGAQASHHAPAAGADRATDSGVGGDVVAGADGAAIRPGYGRRRSRKVAFTNEDRARDVIRNFNADGFASLYPRCKHGHPLKFTLLVNQATHQGAYRIDIGSAWPPTDLVFTTRTGRPVEPRNLVRSFRRLCDSNKLRTIKVHHLRHTVASLLKDLHVPARDAQAILGHSRVSTTLEVYTNVDEQARHDALTRLHRLLDDRQG
jgi:integrase